MGRQHAHTVGGRPAGWVGSHSAGDLAYLKLVGRLARLGRRATVEEVEAFYAPYAPFRGLAALLSTAASGAHPRGANAVLPG